MIAGERLPWLAAAAWVGALLGAWAGFGVVDVAVVWLAGGTVLAIAVVVGAARPAWASVAASVVVVLVVAGAGAALRVGAIVGGPVAKMVVATEGGMALRTCVVLVTDARSSPHGGWWALARLEGADVPGTGPVATGERVVLRGSGTLPALGARHEVEGLATPVEGDAVTWFAWQGAVVQVRAVELEAGRGPPGWLASTTWLRDRVAAAANAHLPGAEASLLTGLVTGDVRKQPAVIGDQMTAAGLSHLVAVSGSNVALVVAAVLAGAVVIGAGRRTGLTLALLAVWWFVVLVRAEPSVVRAALMASLVLGAMLVGRRRHTLSLLSGAVVVALLADPLLAGRLGFVLSVAATAGVVVLAPLVRPRLRGPARWRTALATTLGAQAAVAPVLLVSGGRVGASAVLANVVAVPAAGVSSVVGVAAAVAAPIAPDVAGWICALARPSLAVVLWAARTFAGPLGQRVDRVGWVVLLGGVVVVAVRWAATRSRVWPQGRTGRLALAGPAVVPLAVMVLFVGSPGVAVPDAPTLVGLDVGQGDALLLADPVAGWMLVDGGPDPIVLRRGLRRHGIDRLAAVVLTHPHADHADGLAGLVSDIGVGALIVGPLSEESTLVAEARAAGVPVSVVSAGASWRLGSTAVEVLSPPPGGIAGDPNESSLVLRLDVDGGASVLLTGDAELIAQTRLLTDPGAIDVDLLKVPHHGGDTNADGFLAATTPEVAVISAGRGNPFGHPHPDVLADLAGVEVGRTDLDGDVVVSLLP